MKVKYLIPFTLLFLFLSNISFGQKKEVINTISSQLEQALVDQRLNDMLILVENLYQQDTTLPNEGAFFLGYVLHAYGKPIESKKALLRYIDLTKETGKYYTNTVKIVHQIDKKLNKEEATCDICKTLGPHKELDTCSVCLGHGKEVTTCHRCQGTGHEVCPSCAGTGYERISNGMQVNFQPCKICHRDGFITCVNCYGTKKETSFCENCSGEGLAPKPRVCNHKTETKTYFYR